MDQQLIARLAFDLVVILAGGFLAGIVCKRFGISMLVGYLLVGAVVGPGLASIGEHEASELEYLAQAGVLLLLFSIGLEFSLNDLRDFLRPFFVGGSIQMLLVAVPVAIFCRMIGRPWPGALLLGTAVAFSSTVLVFKALDEWGQAASPHGRRITAVLLFQDAAIIPLVLLIPLMIAQVDAKHLASAVGILALKSAALLVAFPIGRKVIQLWIAPRIARVRSSELLVLFSVAIITGSALFAFHLGLPVVIGAFGAGLMLNGSRLTRQIEAITLPFRETFAAVFFVSLGAMLRLDVLVESPLICIAALLIFLLIKIVAGAIAIRCTGVPWIVAFGSGLGLGQVGEFAFVILLVGVTENVVAQADFQLILFIAIVTLCLTPSLLKLGLRFAEQGPGVGREMALRPRQSPDDISRAVVVGAGPIGGRIASQLETLGYDACLIDLSAINLHPFAQAGFRTAVGDASSLEVLARADVIRSDTVVVTVPDDVIAARVVESVRRLNKDCRVLVRCRYLASESHLKKIGATSVFSEEGQLGGALTARLLQWREESSDS